MKKVPMKMNYEIEDSKMRETLDVKKFLLNSPIISTSERLLILSSILENLKEFEQPDFYSIIGDTVYIIEHFEFDSSVKNRKGSESEISIAEDERRMDKHFDGKLESKTYIGSIKCSRNGNQYVKNFVDVLSSHYKKISAYKKKISGIVGKNEKEIDFKVIFFVVDKTIFGNPVYFPGGIIPLLPFNSLEIIEYLKDLTDLDYLIFSSDTFETNGRISWFGERSDISKLPYYKTEFSKIAFPELNPLTISIQIVIPADTIKSNTKTKK